MDSNTAPVRRQTMQTEHMLDKWVGSLLSGEEFGKSNRVRWFRETVNNCEYGTVTFKDREPSDEIHSHVWPGNAGEGRLEWVAGQSGRIGPLEHLGTHNFRDKQAVGRSITWVWSGPGNGPELDGPGPQSPRWQQQEIFCEFKNWYEIGPCDSNYSVNGCIAVLMDKIKSQ